MDATLVNFAGAGFAMVATGMNIDVPKGAIASGLGLVRHLARNGAPEIADLVAETAENIVGNWPRGQIPLSVIAEVLDAMPALMDRHRPDANLIVGALLSARGKDGKSGEDPGRRLAGDIVLRARAAETFTRQNINESLAFFVLERLFTDMLSRRAFLEKHRAALTSYFENGSSNQTQSSNTQSSEGDSEPAQATMDREAHWDESMQQALALASEAEKSRRMADFDAAVDAFTKVAALLPREVSPSRWAQAEHARCHAMIGRAQQASEAPQALAALRSLNEVLNVYTRDTAPKEWALAQIDVADGLSLLGELERDDVMLETAIATYQEVQTITTREEMPKSWAATMSGLGQAKWMLGRRRHNRDILTEAYAHKTAVLDEYEAQGMWDAAHGIREELRDLDAEMERLPLSKISAQIA